MLSSVSLLPYPLHHEPDVQDFGASDFETPPHPSLASNIGTSLPQVRIEARAGRIIYDDKKTKSSLEFAFVWYVAGKGRSNRAADSDCAYCTQICFILVELRSSTFQNQLSPSLGAM